jgi:hypothetical protein
MFNFDKRLAILVVACAGLAACATAPSPPSTVGDRFVLERDLAGQSVARGEFRSITGARRPFTANLNGVLAGEKFTLVEDFAFDDGERNRKTWVLTRVPNGEWTGVREDVVGRARGFQDGNVFRLEYDVRLPSKTGRGRKVRFRDVLALREQGEIANDASVGWHGLHVGAVHLVITRG